MANPITNVADVSVANVAEQTAAAAELTAEQQAEVMAEAKKELSLVGKALRTGNRESSVSQFLAGLHSLRFINLCRKAGKARAFAISELERDLSWWLGKAVDANLIIRAYSAISLLHGDLTPPKSDASKADKSAWNQTIDTLPPLGHFHKAWAQLVERVEGVEETWVLLVGYEEKAKALYESVLGKGVKLEDDVVDGKVAEKGIMTRVREFIVDYMRWKADKKAAEAAAKSDAKDELEGKAKEMEDKANEQQKVVKSLLEQAQQAKPEQKAKIEQEAKEAAKVLEEHRKNMRQLVDQAAEMAKQSKRAQEEAVDSEKKAEKSSARLDKKRGDGDTGRDLPWQALGENAEASSSFKDLAAALHGIICKHPNPEDVIYDILQLHKKYDDASRIYKAALAAFSITWERKTAATVGTTTKPAA